MLLVSALASILLSRRLVGPIEELRTAFRQLTSGNYQVELKIEGTDEISELRTDFNYLAKTMEKNLQSRQRWVADISHELRTPVAILQGEIEAILDGIRKDNRLSIQSLHQEVLRLSRLVNDLHDLSLSDLGAMSYRNRQIDIVALVRDVAEPQQNLLEPDFDIELIVAEQPLWVFADENRLHQLFSNLANNSRQYTSVPGLIRIKVARQGRHVCIDWSDSAPAVRDSDLSRLFERLYRVEGSRNRNSGGSGLGLSLCRSIVEASQGRIVAEHASLGGVSIQVTLPLMPGQDSA